MSTEDVKINDSQSNDRSKFPSAKLTPGKKFARKQENLQANHNALEPSSSTRPRAVAPKTSPNTSPTYSYLNNPKVNFGSEVPHTIKPEPCRLNPPGNVAPPINTDSVYSIMEKIAFPYKLLRKYIQRFPEGLYSDDSSEKLNGTRDVGTLAQTMSLVLNGQAIADGSTVSDNPEVPDTINFSESVERLPLPNVTSKPMRKDANGGFKVSPIIIEMLSPQAGGEKGVNGDVGISSSEEDVSQCLSKEDLASLGVKSGSASALNARNVTASFRGANLFEVISRHVMSITNPGPWFGSSNPTLARFQNQNKQMFSDSMFLTSRGGSDSSGKFEDKSSLGNSTEVTVNMSEDSRKNSEKVFSSSDLADDVASIESNLSGENAAQKEPKKSWRNPNSVNNLEKDSKSLTEMIIRSQMSLHNLVDEESTRERTKHSTESSATSQEDGNTVDSLKSSNENLLDTLNTSIQSRGSPSALGLREMLSRHGLQEDNNGQGRSDEHLLVPSRINFDESVHAVTRKSSHALKLNNPSIEELRSWSPSDATPAPAAKNLARKDKPLDPSDATPTPAAKNLARKDKPLEPSRINFDESVHGMADEFKVVIDVDGNVRAHPLGGGRTFVVENIHDIANESGNAFQVVSPSPSVLALHSVVSSHALHGDQPARQEESQARVGSDVTHTDAGEPPPTLTLFTEKKKARPDGETVQEEKDRDKTVANLFEVSIKQKDDSITIEVTGQSTQEGIIPLAIMLDGVTQGDSVKISPKEDAVVIGGAKRADENNSFETNESNQSTPTYSANENERNTVKRNYENAANEPPDFNWRILPIVMSGTETSRGEDTSIDTSIEKSARLTDTTTTTTTTTPTTTGLISPRVDSDETAMSITGRSEGATSGNSTDESDFEGFSEEWSAKSGPASTSGWSTLTPPSPQSSDSEDIYGDASFSFSQLQFPPDDMSDRSKTPELSLGSASPSSEPTTEYISSDDESLMKYFTTGSSKSSEVDEKLSEVTGRSNKKKPKNTNEENLDLGSKESGQIPRPREMLSIYSNGESSDTSNVTSAKSSPSLTPKTSAWRNGDDAEAASTSVAKTTPSKHVGRSFSFSQDASEFPWRKSDSLSKATAVHSAKVETTSPVAGTSGFPKGDRPEEEARDEDNTMESSANDDVDKRDVPEKKKKKNKDVDNVDEPGKKDDDNRREDNQREHQQSPTKGKSSSDVEEGRKKSREEEPKRSSSEETNRTSGFSLENILPYMRLFFTPVMDEVALDTLHILRGDPGCDVCPLRWKEDEVNARVITIQRDSGDDDRGGEGEVNDSPQSQDKDVVGEGEGKEEKKGDDGKQDGDRRQSHDKEADWEEKEVMEEKKGDEGKEDGDRRQSHDKEAEEEEVEECKMMKIKGKKCDKPQCQDKEDEGEGSKLEGNKEEENKEEEKKEEGNKDEV